jgi:hypothetical protein
VVVDGSHYYGKATRLAQRTPRNVVRVVLTQNDPGQSHLSFAVQQDKLHTQSLVRYTAVINNPSPSRSLIDILRTLKLVDR